MASAPRCPTVSIRRFRRASLAGGAIGLIALLLFAFGPFLSTGFTGSDSLSLIETSRITSLQDLWLRFTRPVMAGTTFTVTEVMYRPFVSLTFAFDYALWGMNAFGFHLTNLLVHLGAALSVWWLLALLGLPAWSSLAGAVVFAFHPLVLATVPVIARRDSLVPVLAFTLGTCLILVAQRDNGYRRIAAFGASVVLVVVALLSKESTFVAVVMLPLLLVGAQLAEGRPPRRAIERIRLAIPSLAAALGIFAIRFSVIGGLGGFNTGSNLLPISFEKYLQILGAYTRYLIWAFAWFAPSPAEIWQRVGAEILLVLTLTLIWLPRRYAVLIAVGALWVVGFGIFCAVLKISTIVFVAYFALLGLALVFAAGLEGTLTRLRSSAVPPRPRAASLVLLTGLAFVGGSWLWSSALFRTYDQWRVAGEVNQGVTQALVGCIAEAPAVSRLTLRGLPDDLDDGRPDTQLLTVTFFRDYTVQSF